MVRFDPEKAERWEVDGDIPNQFEVVHASDYDRLLALYRQERKDRMEDAKEFQRELCDVAAEARWAERQSEDYGYR